MARFELTNRHIGLLIIVVMLLFALLSVAGLGTLDPNLARDFLLLAGGLLTSETARRAIQTQRKDDYSFPKGGPNEQQQQQQPQQTQQPRRRERERKNN